MRRARGATTSCSKGRTTPGALRRAPAAAYVACLRGRCRGSAGWRRGAPAVCARAARGAAGCGGARCCHQEQQQATASSSCYPRGKHRPAVVGGTCCVCAVAAPAVCAACQQHGLARQLHAAWCLRTAAQLHSWRCRAHAHTCCCDCMLPPVLCCCTCCRRAARLLPTALRRSLAAAATARAQLSPAAEVSVLAVWSFRRAHLGLRTGHLSGLVWVHSAAACLCVSLVQRRPL
jgi:hypothetical protein